MSLYFEIYVMFAMTKDVLEKKYAGLSAAEKTALESKGRKLLKKAEKEGVKGTYYENRALPVFAAMKRDGWDFRS